MNQRAWKWLAGIFCGAVLALVFVAYLRPDFMMDLTNRFMLCF
jgi:hypothetical protein